MPAPPQLLELQRSFSRLTRDPRGLALTLYESPHSLDWIVKQPPLSPEERLDIYAEGYFLRLAGNLSKSFPDCRKNMGEADFLRAAAHYYAQYPSHTPQIQETGHAFADFLGTYAAEQPWLQELAQLERQRYVVVHQDAPPIDCLPLSAAAGQGENLELVLNSTVTLLRFEYAVLQVPAGNPLAPESTWVALWKQAGRLFCEALPAAAWTLLWELQQGQSLQQACEQLAATKVSGPELSHWFETWGQKGVFQGILPLSLNQTKPG